MTEDTANTYQGQRNDLANDEMGNYCDKDKMEKCILLLAKVERYGITAGMVEEYTGCSREWARKMLNRLVDQGKLKKKVHTSQCIIFRSVEQ